MRGFSPIRRRANNDRAFTIYSGNPFLPASIQQAMTANSLASVQFGRIGAPEDIGFDAFTQQTTETDSLTGGFYYAFKERLLRQRRVAAQGLLPNRAKPMSEPSSAAASGSTVSTSRPTSSRTL